MKKILKEKKVLITVGVVVVILLILIFVSKLTGDNKGEGREGLEDGENYTSEFSDLSKQEPLNPEEVSPFSGLKCENPDNKDRRAIAVMLASDPSTRPLSGVSSADLVIEMPVITSQVTRLMALYVCNSPEEIGSIRSTRHDFLTLAKGMDAILAHWGGPDFVLNYLKDEDPVPNLDALIYEGDKATSPFWRKPEIPKPDNGFATYDNLLKQAEELGYRTENYFEGYPHRKESPKEERGSRGKLTVGFPKAYKMNVYYVYDPESNSYLRYWAGNMDIDKNTQEQIAPKNVVVVFATSRQIKGQYNDVDIEGEGEMHAYIEGKEIQGTWVKEKENCVIGDELVCVSSSKLKFLNEDGEEITFIPGQVWIEVLEPGQKLEWEPL
ncbi:MAG: DUF3048 domain-containing protein [Candidatus Moranbacteria bacterium]|nr:DUF3048 domain-containing protein [Candidatus Moranbacteria bacterium]